LKDPAGIETPESDTMTLPNSDADSEVGGASAAFDLDNLYRAHAATVARWAARLVGPGADVEDIVHEIFLVAGRRLPEFRGEAKVSTWLYRITERVALGYRRRDRFRRRFWLTRSSEIEDTFAPS
jgi:RNA polymerase sigma factor (sigma-70 family)